jgi:GxxExxY protein
MEHEDLTEQIIGAAFRVYNRIGFGFLESVYERCLALELTRAGLKVETQTPINVYYDDVLVGEFIADLLVAGTIIVELKSVRTIAPAHEAQLVNYLAATGKSIGLLLNFGESGVDVRRKTRDYRPTNRRA